MYLKYYPYFIGISRRSRYNIKTRFSLPVGPENPLIQFGSKGLLLIEYSCGSAD